jgi:hypothetical protein
MRSSMALFGALAAVVAVLSFTATTAAAAPTAPTFNVPISSTQSGGALSGVFTLTGFALNEAGQLVANGTFTGTLTNAAGDVTNLVNTAVSSLVTAPGSTTSCQVLDLTLGPLHLDLLGLVVDLNQVHLTITAQPGPGNLLGNLLCAVTHLLDNPSATTSGLQNLLTVVNGILGGV